MSLSQTFTSRVPSFDKFKKLNSIMLKPPNYERRPEKIEDPVKSKSSKGLILNNTTYNDKTKQNLSEIYQSYIQRFEKISKDVINSKYDSLFQSIYKFIQFSGSDTAFSSLIINTDQNSGSFFDGLKKYLAKRIIAEKKDSQYDMGHLLIPKGEIHFKDLSKLFYDLNIDNLNYEYNDVSLTRIIIIGEIHRIDSNNLNLFLQRMMEYRKEIKKHFNYVLMFDVVYDPKSLFDSIKANYLTKMSFYILDNVPSKNIYKEVLYKFIYERSHSIFIPNSDNTKIIVDYVNNNQISIESFKHYFKFLIFQFFLMHNWDDDEYLLFHQDLETLLDNSDDISEKEKKELINQTFKDKLLSIYGENKKVPLDYKEDVENLSQRYEQKMLNRKIFFDFYMMFENILLEISIKNPTFIFDRYQFFFEFLQYGSSQKKENVKNNRVSVLLSYFQAFPDQDYAVLLSDYLLPHFTETIDSLATKEIPNKEELSSSKDYLVNIVNTMNDPKNIVSLKILLEKITHWLNNLLSLDFFFSITIYDFDTNSSKRKRKWLNIYILYLKFYEMVNPNMLYILIEKLQTNICNIKNNPYYEIIKKDYSVENTLCCFIKCLMRLGSCFKLKFFFWEFINELGIEDINKEKDDVIKMKKIFLYFSYMFCLIGFFSRKKGTGELFLKNYFNATSYYVK